MNERAEEILLGSILKDNAIIEELTVSPEHFMEFTNQNMYKAMLRVKRKGFPIDTASMKDDLGETGYFLIGGDERIEELKKRVPSIEFFKLYEEMVINQWKINTSIDLMKATLESDLNIEALHSFINELNKVDESGTQDEFNLKTHLIKMYELVTVETPKGRSGISSGYMDIDKLTDGFMGNDLIIVGARPSMGKTAFVLNLAINSGEKGVIPVVFSLEMTAESLIKRIMSRLTEINGMKLKNPYHYTNDEEKEKWIEKLGTLEKLNLKIYDKPRQTVSEMRAKLRRIKHENPDKKMIIFIDYLTLIKSSQDYRGNSHAMITEISADLKTMAKDFNCPVICLAQLNRGVENRDNKRPNMSDLRESGSIEQDADLIMMLYRDEYYNPQTEDKNVLEVDVKKNRDGEVGLVKLRYKKQINKIENLYHYHKK